MLAAVKLFELKKLSSGAAARLAGIMAAKRTSELIPMCHPLPLSHVDVDMRLCENGVAITSKVKTRAETGVEMEALVAAIRAFESVEADFSPRFIRGQVERFDFCAKEIRNDNYALVSQSVSCPRTLPGFLGQDKGLARDEYNRCGWKGGLRRRNRGILCGR